MVAVALTAAAAQQAPVVPVNTDRVGLLDQHQQELDKLRGEQRKASETEATLTREIEALGADRRKLNQDLIDTAGRIRALEGKITATETRLVPLDERNTRLKQSLESRRAVIANVLAALQRVGRKPPPALLVSPEDALQSVRTAILLGAVVPEMRNETEALAADLTELLRVRKSITDERDQLRAQADAIENERKRMAALIGERQKQQSDREASLTVERARATDLARQAESLKELIAKMEAELDSASRATRETARTDPRAGAGVLNDPGRLAPGVTFVSLRGRIPLPVNGVKIRDYAAPDGSGGSEKGLSIATRAGAQVTAPADGWVVYAGPFRSYGQLLILNAGGGYHVLLAGMERISVDLGQFVLAGEPVAVMGNGSRIAAILTTGSSQPVLYIEFRKDGTPIDPGPWWAAGEVEKVRG